MPKLETLELEIVQKSQTSTAGVKDLAEALSSLAKAGEATGKLSKASDALTGIASAAGGLKEASAGVRTVANAMKRMNDVLENAPFAVHGLQRISEALQKIGEAASKLSGVGENIRDINRAAKDAGKIPGTSGGSNGLPTAGDDIVDGESSGALDETAKKAEETQQSVSKATLAVRAFRDSLRGLGKGALSIGKSLGKRMLGNFTKDIKSAVSTMGNLFSSFKRIAMYRGLRTAIKAITQGFTTGVKHLYAWADLVGNNFKQSMDSLSTSMNYMRNSLGAMVSPIIDALAPAVDILVDKFVDLINVVNQFLATITGASSWRRAVKEQKEYADETDKAAGAQKRLNHQLMAFDELNNITVNQPSSRGSGNKDDEVTDGSFVVEQLPDWAKDIREAIENGMWKTAGTLLAQKLNGLIDDWDANAFGKKLGEKFQNGIDAYLGFMKTFKWNQLGIKAADFINGMLSSVNPSDLGEAIVQKFNAAIGFLGGFASELDWDALGKWVVDVLFGAINGIQWETLGDTIGTIVSGIATMIISAFNELIKHPGDIVDAVKGFFKGLFEGLWGEDGSGLVNVISTVALIAGFKVIFKNVFGDGGLISFVKEKVTGFFGAVGLSGLATIAVTVEAARELVGWIDKIKEKGFSEGTLEYFGVDTRGSVFINVAPLVNDFKSAMEEAFRMDPENLPFFKKVIEIVKAFAKVFGIDFDYGGSSSTGSGSVTQNTPGSKQDPTTGEWFLPEIDSTKQVQAIKNIQTAATNAKAKVKQLPPADDEVSKFQSQTKKETTAVNGVKTAANNAGKSVDQRV